MLRLLPLVLLGSILAASPLRAEDSPVPPVTPMGQYFALTYDNATSSSKCIGDPKTPLCAVETIMACRMRAEIDLCRIAMDLKSSEQINPVVQRWPARIYRVSRAEVLTDRTFPWRPSRRLKWRPGEISMKAGDIRIDIVEHWCHDEMTRAACDPASTGTKTYIVRQIGDRWAVIEVGNPNDPRNRYQ
jgi:hypothetical protein